MAITLTDVEIDGLIREVKPLPANYRDRIKMRPRRGHREREFDVQGKNGSEFRVILRESLFNHLDFSVILAYRPPKQNQLFRLRRYNGKSHEHSNKLERQRFYDFHIHTATERYQDSGFREDTYAQPTDRYSDFAGALECLLEDCGFDRPEDDRLPLFEGED